MRDLVDEVGRDAVRYFFLMRKARLAARVRRRSRARAVRGESGLLHPDGARAHVRDLPRRANRPATIDGSDGVDLAVLTTHEERELIKALLDFPELVVGAAQALEPHRIATYLLETARLAHIWYHKHHVLERAGADAQARLVLARAAQIVLRNGLRILGITAPERM